MRRNGSTALRPNGIAVHTAFATTFAKVSVVEESFGGQRRLRWSKKASSVREGYGGQGGKKCIICKRQQAMFGSGER